MTTYQHSSKRSKKLVTVLKGDSERRRGTPVKQVSNLTEDECSMPTTSTKKKTITNRKQCSESAYKGVRSTIHFNWDELSYGFQIE
jgi:hypothetical protein